MRFDQDTCRQKAQGVIALVTIVAVAAVSESGTVKGPLLTLRKGGTGNPMLLDTSYGYNGFNPSTRSHGSLAVNLRTGMVYALDFADGNDECLSYGDQAEDSG
ncbi:MAG: hypothetical protein ACUVWX_09300, partial [Kiritimatiellia bacterium]